jgi:hypothetical protein
MTSRNARTCFSSALALLIAIVVAACSIDAPTAPQGHIAPAAPAAADDQADNASVGGNHSNVRLFACATPDFGSVTKRVGPAGGLIRIGPHILIIPRGALRESVDITASAPASAHVRVRFSPHGLKLHAPAILVLSYKHCKSLAPRRPKIAHVDDLQDSILELLPSKHIRVRDAVATSLRCFSGYAIAD